MFSFTEFRGQSALDKHGGVELNTEFFRLRRPAWLVLLKILGVVAMVTVGFAIALPSIKECYPQFAMWKAVLAVSGAMIVYTAIAFFVRPEANGDNMGWLGGSYNDPTQYSDNINRFLWKLHMLLGPGRFTAETLLDTCVLVGFMPSADPVDQSAPPQYMGGSPEEILASVSRPPAQDQQPPGPPGVQLDSWKYFQNQS
ncbi:MAG: hypothetical protein L0211_24025 [Planctomycetaceae bacterium]|nr:hypothetical protein [Planctomycetaceae bacterium]